MKRSFIGLLIGIYIIPNFLSAQKLVSENKLWSNTLSPCFHTEDYMSHWIKFEGDTLINDTLYKKIYKATNQSHTYWREFGAIREDTTGKVYLHQNNYQRLLYDFTVNMGDTLKADDYSIMFDCYVVNVEYILLDAFKDSLKKIEVIWKESGEFTAKHTWIQGIGSLHGMPLGLEQFNMVGGANMLVCMFENDTLKYHNEYFSDCYPLGFPENIERNVINGGTLEVISSKNLIQFVYKQLESNHAALRIFDISGRSMGLYSFNKSGDVTLNKNEHANGVYIYILQDGAKRISGKFIIK